MYTCAMLPAMQAAFGHWVTMTADKSLNPDGPDPLVGYTFSNVVD